MSDAQERFHRLCQIMDEHLRTMSPQERDRMMQRHLAMAKTPEERFQALAELMDFTINLNQAQRGIRDD